MERGGESGRCLLDERKKSNNEKAGLKFVITRGFSLKKKKAKVKKKLRASFDLASSSAKYSQ